MPQIEVSGSVVSLNDSHIAPEVEGVISSLANVGDAVDAGGDWLVGMPVQVSLPSAAPAEAVSVPRDALVERGGQTFVYRVTDEGTAEQLNASVRTTFGLWAGIAEGIEPGDRVIVRGAERLAPGQAVERIVPRVSE